MRTLMFKIAEDTHLYIRGGYASVVVLILSFMLIIGAFWLWWWLGLIGLLLLSLVCLANSLVIVEAQNSAYAVVLGKSPSHTMYNGLRCVWPFITNVVMIETRPTEFNSINKDVNMPKGVVVEVEWTLAYQLIARNVYRFASEWTKFELAFPSAMKTAIRAILTAYECDEILDDNNKTTRIALKEEIRLELEKKFLEILEDNYYKTGLNTVFESISLSAMDIVFPESYLEARRAVVEAEQKAKAAEANKKAQIIEAEGISLATIEMAKGDAKSIRLKGDAENKVLEEKGRILTEKPAISENAAAQKPPQTLVVTGNGGGGITPVMDILRGLYPHKDDEEETTSTPTP